MAEPNLLAESRIAILGLGLMGGSLAMALKGQCTQTFGIDPDPLAVAYAQKHKIVDLAVEYPHDVLPRADIIILAAPVGGILKLIQSLPELHPGKAIVLDIGSTKAVIVREMEKLPSRFDPLGGHPMCGKEKAGLAHADGKLFWDSTFALTETARTTPALRLLVDKIITIISAQPLWIDAFTHDRWAAATSHMPYLVSSALAASVSPEVAPLVGPGFQSTCRLAASDITMMMDILATNRGQVLEALSHYREALDQITMALKECDDKLPTLLEKARQNRARLVMS